MVSRGRRKRKVFRSRRPRVSFWTRGGIKECSNPGFQEGPAHHPQANGVVERFHRQLKVSFKAHEAPSQWVHLLPVVLLCLQSAVKEDLSCRPSQLVFGTTLCFPAEFVGAKSTQEPLSGDSYVTILQDIFHAVRPTRTRATISQTAFVACDLNTSSDVFLRTDCVRRPLEAPYTCPHLVLARQKKTFKTRFNSRYGVVSIDQLKPGYFESSKSSATLSSSSVNVPSATLPKNASVFV